MAKWFLLAALVARSLFDTMEFIGVVQGMVFCRFLWFSEWRKEVSRCTGEWSRCDDGGVYLRLSTIPEDISAKLRG